MWFWSGSGTVEACATCFFQQNCLDTNLCLTGSEGDLCERCVHYSDLLHTGHKAQGIVYWFWYTWKCELYYSNAIFHSNWLGRIFRHCKWVRVFLSMFSTDTKTYSVFIWRHLIILLIKDTNVIQTSLLLTEPNTAHSIYTVLCYTKHSKL